MKKLFIVTICFFALVTSNGQAVEQRLPGAEEISNRRTSFNLEEIKVRWKKAALENCTGVPCAGGASFTCGTSTVADIDGNTYNTVLIGSQCWTKENLKVTKYNDGTLIPLDASGTTTGNVGETWSGRTTGARTVYEHNNTYLTTYGYLYNWYAATDSKKICPVGWHVPDLPEWNIFLKTLDPSAANIVNPGLQSSSAGGKIKTPTGWASSSNPSNSTGFSGLPAGTRYGTGFGPGFFNDLTDHTYWWSTTTNANNTSAWDISIWDSANDLDAYLESLDSGNSIRCLKN